MAFIRTRGYGRCQVVLSPRTVACESERLACWAQAWCGRSELTRFPGLLYFAVVRDDPPFPKPRQVVCGGMHQRDHLRRCGWRRWRSMALVGGRCYRTATPSTRYGGRSSHPSVAAMRYSHLSYLPIMICRCRRPGRFGVRGGDSDQKRR